MRPFGWAFWVLLAGCMEQSPFQSPLLHLGEVGFVRWLVSDGDELYWAAQMGTADGGSRPGAVGRLRKDGSDKKTLVELDDADAYDVAVDDAYVYYIERPRTTGRIEGFVYRVAKAGGEPELIATDYEPCGLAIDATHVYWTAAAPDGVSPTTMVRRVPRAGGEIRTSPGPTLDGSSRACRLALDDTYVYWYATGNDVTLLRTDKDGVTGTEVLATLEGAGGGDSSQGVFDPGIAVSGDNVYFALQGGGIAMAPKTGGSNTFIKTQGRYRTIVIADRELYLQLEPRWEGGGDPAEEGFIERRNLAGEDPHTVAGSKGTPQAMVIDDTHVYWASNEGMSILGTPR